MERKKTFSEIMEDISAGLTGDPQHDGTYLQEQMEAYKGHPLSDEIQRACGKLIWDALPAEAKTTFEQLIEGQGSNVQTLIDEAFGNLQEGNHTMALGLIEPLAQKYDEMTEDGGQGDGWDNDQGTTSQGTPVQCASQATSDQDVTFLNLDSAVEYYLFKLRNNTGRQVRPATEPFATVYSLYGSALLKAERYDEAIKAFEKAIRWNPVKPIFRFGLGETYKKLGDMATYARILDEVHPLITSGEDMARFHRARGYLLIEDGKFELAAAHLRYSLIFENSPSALDEVAFIKENHGEDYTDMTPEAAKEILERECELCEAAEDIPPLLSSVIKMAVGNGDNSTAVQAAVNLYQLTGDEQVRKLVEDLIAAAEEVRKE